MSNKSSLINYFHKTKLKNIIYKNIHSDISSNKKIYHKISLLCYNFHWSNICNKINKINKIIILPNKLHNDYDFFL